MNKYFHTSLTKSQRILDTLMIPSLPDDKYNVLLFYTNYMEVLQVEDSPTVTVSKVAQYPLGVRIVWSRLVGEHIVAVTNDGRMMVLESQPPFSRVWGGSLCTGISPSQIPVAHFALSRNGENLVCSGFTEKVVLTSLRDITAPAVSMCPLMIEGDSSFVVMGVEPTADPNEFVMLVAVMASKERMLVRFSVAQGAYRVVEKRVLRAPNIEAIVSVFVGEGVCRTILLASDHIFNEDESKSIPIRSQVGTWFVTNDGILYMQTVDRRMLVLNVSEMRLTERGSLPLVTKFSVFDRQVFCVAESCAPFVLPLPTAPDQIFDYRDVSRVSLPLTPCVTNGIMTENGQLAISYAGQDPSGVTVMKNSIPFHREYVEEPSSIFASNASSLGYKPPRFINDTVTLFTIGDDVLVSSTSENSGVLIGQMDSLLDGATLAAGPFFDDFLQVTRTEIKALRSGKEWKGVEDIISAAVSEEYCVVCLQNNHCVLFGEDLEVLVDREIGVVLCFAFCGDVLAVATEQQGANSSMTLYSMDLLPTDIEAQFTSPVCSMLFYAPDCVLFISTLAGNVSKWFLNSGEMSLSSCEMYASSVPASLVQFGDYVLVMGEKCLLANEDNLMAINLGDPLAVAAHGRDSLWVLSKQHELYLYTIEDFDSDIDVSMFRASGRPRKLLYVEDGIVAACRTRTAEGYRSSVDLIKGDKVITKEFGNNSGILSALKLPVPNKFVIGLVTPTKCCLLIFLRVEGESIIEEQTIPWKEPPHAMALVNSYLIVGSGRRIYTLRYDGDQWAEPEQNEPLASVHTQVAFLEARGSFVWVGDRTQSILCFSHTFKDGKLAITPQAVDTKPRQLTAMKCIDDFTIAVGDRYGTITILKLPEDVQVKLLWKTSLPPERGVYMPNCFGHLVRIASFNTAQTITSLMYAGKTLYYTTLLGQIGALVQLQDDQEYFFLTGAENAINKVCQKNFGFTLLKRIENGKVSVVDGDILETIETLPSEDADNIPQAPKLQLVSMVTKLMTSVKF